MSTLHGTSGSHPSAVGSNSGGAEATSGVVATMLSPNVSFARGSSVTKVSSIDETGTMTFDERLRQALEVSATAGEGLGTGGFGRLVTGAGHRSLPDGRHRLGDRWSSATASGVA
ncbi:hypothetical protein C5C00_08340 [Rathayibacter rathayi]|nr:hypothetical protein C5C00_08340 [Rathayibacter rathayi]